MNHVNKIFRVAVDMIMNGSYFPGGRKGIICTVFGDIAAGNKIFAASKGSLDDVKSDFQSIRNVFLFLSIFGEFVLFC